MPLESIVLLELTRTEVYLLYRYLVAGSWTGSSAGLPHGLSAAERKAGDALYHKIKKQEL